MRARAALLLASAAMAVVLLRSLPLPVLDEETWLSITASWSPLHPYDWWRPGPPWGGSHEPDALVFAHLPGFLLWVWSFRHLSADIPTLRWLVALPWAALLGLSVSRLGGARGAMAGLLWLTAPITVLGLQDGLMPDLMVSALMAASAASWVHAWERGSRPFFALSGLLLGAAVCTKYPALVLVPVFLLDGLYRDRLRASLVFWTALLLCWGACEGWLWASYGRPHLWEVLRRVGEIPRGPLTGRLLGTLARLSLGCSPLLVAAVRRAWIPAFLLGGAALLLAWPADLSSGERAFLLALAVGGAGLLATVVRVPARSERDDSFLLMGWVLVVVAGVVLGHNYASPRYLLPAMAPLAALLSRQLPRAWLGAAILAQLGLAVVLSTAEARYAEAADAVASDVVDAYPNGGWFLGEWTFRWRMEQAGWLFYTGEAAPKGVIAAAVNASPGPLPDLPEQSRFGAGLGALRLLDVEDGVGFYAETLGPLPLGWRPGRLEEVRLWRAP